MIAPIENIQTKNVLDNVKTDTNNNTGNKDNKRIISNTSTANSDLNTSTTNNSSAQSTDAKNHVDYKELSDAISSILKNSDTFIEFSVDKDTKKVVMKEVNYATNEIVKQYPPEETLKIARIVANILDQGKVTNAKV